VASFLIDEDLPRNLAASLRASGLDATDVRDAGLGGAPDSAIFEHARRRNLAIVTADLGFASLLTYPLGTHRGIVVARLPQELPVPSTNRRIVEALLGLLGEDLTETLVIIEPDRVRLRRV
jgi:predicted nuclease of predicted toxin-antitoxin system